jgi:hypothetical protein
LDPANGVLACRSPPPVKDGVACHLDLKKTYRVAKVARSGLRRPFGHSIPAAIAFSHEVTRAGAGTSHQTGSLLKAARRIIARHKRTRVLVTLAVEREDGYLWSEPKLNRRITLVR